MSHKHADVHVSFTEPEMPDSTKETSDTSGVEVLGAILPVPTSASYCPVCKKGFSSQSACADHVRKVHDTGRRLTRSSIKVEKSDDEVNQLAGSTRTQGKINTGTVLCWDDRSTISN